jgi:predicted GIY-YIG superfamily endonuclease
MASRSLNLYTGMTNDIYRRALEHKSAAIEGFTKKYHINPLVYYEIFQVPRECDREGLVVSEEYEARNNLEAASIAAGKKF